MYYLLEQDVMTGKWETNFTMYASSPEELMNRVCPDGMYMRECKTSLTCHDRLAVAPTAPTAIMYRIMHPRDSFLDKFVGVIYSIG